MVGDDAKKNVYQLVGSAEAEPREGKISDESPVGKALAGHKVGDRVEIRTQTRTSYLTIELIT